MLLLLSQVVITSLASTSPLPPVSNISNDALASADGHVAVSGQHVYTVWTSAQASGSNEVLFRGSGDFGATWGPVKNLSSNVGQSIYPRVKAVGSHVYVFWTDKTLGSSEIYFRSSNDYGVTWASATDISNTGTPSRHFRTLASGNNVYVAWVEKLSKSNEVLFRASHDSGSNWGPTLNLSNDVNDSEGIKLASYEAEVFAVWMSNTPGHFQVMFDSSLNAGSSWGSAISVSNDGGNATVPDVSVQGNGAAARVYVVWQDDTLGNAEIMFRQSLDS